MNNKERHMRYIGLLLSILLSTPGHAFKCYFTMVKAECWKSYDLTVDVSDADTGKAIKKITVAENELWARETFDCEPAATIAVIAKFSPVFWAGDEHKTYQGRRFWKLPHSIRTGDTGWNVTVCYPSDFSDVPTPPVANTNCKCDLMAVPKIVSGS